MFDRKLPTFFEKKAGTGKPEMICSVLFTWSVREYIGSKIKFDHDITCGLLRLLAFVLRYYSKNRLRFIELDVPFEVFETFTS
jgi:hypothetical protein